MKELSTVMRSSVLPAQAGVILEKSIFQLTPVQCSPRRRG